MLRPLLMLVSIVVDQCFALMVVGGSLILLHSVVLAAILGGKEWGERRGH